MLSSDRALVESVEMAFRSDGGLQGFPLVACEGRGTVAVEGVVLAILSEEKMVVIDLARWSCRLLRSVEYTSRSWMCRS